MSKKRDPRQIAGDRMRRADGHYYRDPISGNRVAADHIGAIAEHVVCRDLGIDPAVIAVAGPVRANLVLADGTRLDVCGSPTAGFLLVPPAKAARTDVDAYVLVQVDRVRDDGLMIGWATADEVRAAEVAPVATGRPPSHRIRSGALRPIRELRDRHVPHMLPLFVTTP